jgi:hypothetical protein
VACAFSSGPSLLLLLLFAILIFVPLPIALKRIPGYMPVVGSNSLAIAAACHVSPLTNVTSPDPSSKTNALVDVEGTEGETTALKSDRTTVETKGLDQQRDRFVRMSQCLLKWGIVKMPKEWQDQYEPNQSSDGAVEHLSFGTILDEPREPVNNRWYG